MIIATCSTLELQWPAQYLVVFTDCADAAGVAFSDTQIFWQDIHKNGAR